MDTRRPTDNKNDKGTLEDKKGGYQAKKDIARQRNSDQTLPQAGDKPGSRRATESANKNEIGAISQPLERAIAQHSPQPEGARVIAGDGETWFVQSKGETRPFRIDSGTKDRIEEEAKTNAIIKHLELDEKDTNIRITDTDDGYTVIDSKGVRVFPVLKETKEALEESAKLPEPHDLNESGTMTTSLEAAIIKNRPNSLRLSDTARVVEEAHDDVNHKQGWILEDDKGKRAAFYPKEADIEKILNDAAIYTPQEPMNSAALMTKYEENAIINHLKLPEGSQIERIEDGEANEKKLVIKTARNKKSLERNIKEEDLQEVLDDARREQREVPTTTIDITGNQARKPGDGPDTTFKLKEEEDFKAQKEREIASLEKARSRWKWALEFAAATDGGFQQVASDVNVLADALLQASQGSGSQMPQIAAQMDQGIARSVDENYMRKIKLKERELKAGKPISEGQAQRDLDHFLQEQRKKVLKEAKITEHEISNGSATCQHGEAKEIRKGEIQIRSYDKNSKAFIDDEKHKILIKNSEDHLWLSSQNYAFEIDKNEKGQDIITVADISKQDGERNILKSISVEDLKKEWDGDIDDDRRFDVGRVAGDKYQIEVDKQSDKITIHAGNDGSFESFEVHGIGDYRNARYRDTGNDEIKIDIFGLKDSQKMRSVEYLKDTMRDVKGQKGHMYGGPDGLVKMWTDREMIVDGIPVH